MKVGDVGKERKRIKSGRFLEKQKCNYGEKD